MLATRDGVNAVDEKLLRSMTDTIVDEVDPEEIVLFGSHARGTGHADSDIDLLVVMRDEEQTRWKRRHITGRLYRRLAPYRIPKDILVYTRGEVEKWRHVPGHVVATSMTEGRRVYART